MSHLFASSVALTGIKIYLFLKSHQQLQNMPAASTLLCIFDVANVMNRILYWYRYNVNFLKKCQEDCM